MILSLVFTFSLASRSCLDLFSLALFLLVTARSLLSLLFSPHSLLSLFCRDLVLISSISLVRSPPVLVSSSSHFRPLFVVVLSCLADLFFLSCIDPVSISSHSRLVFFVLVSISSRSLSALSRLLLARLFLATFSLSSLFFSLSLVLLCLLSCLVFLAVLLSRSRSLCFSSCFVFVLVFNACCSVSSRSFNLSSLRSQTTNLL